MSAGHKPLSPGERAVWAAEFVTTFNRLDRTMAARRASEAVRALRLAAGDDLDETASAMLDDMLGNPGELICPDDGKAVFAADVCTRCTLTAAYHRSRR